MNIDADTLSRFPVKLQDTMPEHTESMSTEMVSAVWQDNKAAHEKDVPWIGALQIDEGNADPVVSEIISAISPENVQAVQQEDQAIKEVMSLKLRKWTPNVRDRRNMNRQTRSLLYEWNKLEMEEGILYKLTDHHKQLVLPEKLKSLVLKALHVMELWDMLVQKK